MKTTIERNGNQAIVTLDGNLDTVNSIEFLDKINELLLTESELHIVVDCKDLLYISSSGLRAFKTLQKGVDQGKGSAIVRNLQPEVYKIFKLTGFHKIMTIEE